MPREQAIEIERTVIAKGRTFRVTLERRVDLRSLQPMWSYRLTEFIGHGVRSYGGTTTRLKKWDVWGDVMHRVDRIVNEAHEDDEPVPS